MPQIGPNQWIFISNVILILSILPIINNLNNSERTINTNNNSTINIPWNW